MAAFLLEDKKLKQAVLEDHINQQSPPLSLAGSCQSSVAMPCPAIIAQASSKYSRSLVSHPLLCFPLIINFSIMTTLIANKGGIQRLAKMRNIPSMSSHPIPSKRPPICPFPPTRFSNSKFSPRKSASPARCPDPTRCCSFRPTRRLRLSSQRPCCSPYTPVATRPSDLAAPIKVVARSSQRGGGMRRSAPHPNTQQMRTLAARAAVACGNPCRYPGA